MNAALDIARRWWRPVTAWGVALAVFNLAVTILINGVWLPLAEKKSLDFSALGSTVTALATLVASLTPLVIARSWEKGKGVDGQ